MSALSYPDRMYLLSDTFGGNGDTSKEEPAVWHPFTSPDIEAHIATDIRSDFRGVRQKFDIFGAEKISDHVLCATFDLQNKNSASGTTGIFVNHAARTEKGKNGEPFYVAQLGDAVRVVATPLSALSAVRNRIHRLYHLPNENNGLYGPHEQFRSSFTPRLLAQNHGLELVEDDPSIYPAATRRRLSILRRSFR